MIRDPPLFYRYFITVNPRLLIIDAKAMQQKKVLDQDSTVGLEGDEKAIERFRKYVFTPLNKTILESGADLKQLAELITNFALDHDITHYSFLSFPYNSAICQKQESFLDIKYIYDEGLKGITKCQINPDLLIKGEADGSSFPSAGLMCTHRARAYTLWDQQSQVFIRRKNKVMYIPAMLVTHDGNAMDDKTLFRKSELVMKNSAKKMLQALNVPCKEIIINLGLEQEFFVIPKKAYLLRPDIMHTGRSLVGYIGAKGQQFSDHYYGKIPSKIEEILNQVENQLLEMGIPFKTKHNEVANNQFEFACIYKEAGKAIDHNLIIMEILKEVFDKHGYTALLHEKPFQQLNGSGKHANWSINYVDQNNDIKNMFRVPSEQKDYKLFQLFILLNLMALKRNNTLYLAAVAPPGNEVRLGGHEAPPRIISAYLGQSISAILEGKAAPARLNLRDKIPSLSDDVYQQDTNRNRTSPYAFTTNKFQFRALGSSQNPAYPMAVISATMAKQFQIATTKLQNGYTLDSLIEQLKSQAMSVNFQGNGYSKQWVIQAKKRGLYVNEEYVQILEKVRGQSEVFIEIGACNATQIDAKCSVMQENYISVVQCEAKALLQVALQKIVPRGYSYLGSLGSHQSKGAIGKYVAKFTGLFESSLESLEELEKLSESCNSLAEAARLRKRLTECGELLSKVSSMLEKDDKFPDLEDFLLM